MNVDHVCYDSERSDMPHKPVVRKNAAAQALGRLGGSANTKAQQRARKKNAQLAGRPGRVCTDCGNPVFGGHKDRRLDAKCSGQTWRWQRQDEK